MAAPTRFLGITCPSCGYDVRGLAQPVCPECGNAFDPDAKPQPRATPALGWVAAVVAALSAGFVIWWCTDLTGTYYRELGGWCGTGRVRAHSIMTGLVPVALLIPAGAAVASWWAGGGFKVARTAAAAAGVVWLLCYWLICNPSVW